MSFEEYMNNPLWTILQETVHSIIMYPHHKAYTRDVMLNEQQDITPKELAAKLSISLGEAMVILFELRQSQAKIRPSEQMTP
jgi:transcription initiation factor IIE alpha subunit